MKTLNFIFCSFFVFWIFSCSQEESFFVNLENAFNEVSTRNLDLLEENQEDSSLINVKKSGFIHFFNQNWILQKEEFDSTQNNFEIKISKGMIVPILIEFETDSLQKLCTGQLYPLITEFSIYSGFCALVYQKLLRCSNQKYQQADEFCRFFNWQKFYQAIQKFPNPFLLDIDLICNDIATNQFTAHSLKLKE